MSQGAVSGVVKAPDRHGCDAWGDEAGGLEAWRQKLRSNDVPGSTIASTIGAAE